MRIGFDSKRLFLNNRGLGNYARNLLYGLLKYHPENEYFLYTPSVSNEYVSPGLLNSENVHTRTPSGLMNLSGSYWRSGKLGSQINNDNLDIFHGLAQELPLNIKKANSKSIVTVHDMIFLKHPEFYKPIDRWIYFKKVKFAIQNADQVVAVSNQTKKDLIEKFEGSEDNISVIHQSCNEIFYEERKPYELNRIKEKWSLPEEYILFVGALNDNKNVLAILKAMNVLKGKLDLPLVVVGRGEDYKIKMLEYAEKNSLQKQMIFASDVANPTPTELSGIYQMASVFVFPSYYEGFGIPILESRFSGTPVIASNSSCLDEAGGDDTVYFNPDDFEELAQKISDVLDNKNEFKANLDSYTIDASVKKMVALYTWILNE